MAWFDAPEADRREQEQVVLDGYDEDGDDEPDVGAPRSIPLEAPVADVLEQRQVVPEDDWDDPRG
jgi:hypothetical protein